jgi:uncharacterized protein YndB with AHSA1/START domain
MADDSKGEIRWTTLVRAPVERVYEAFATGEGQDGWWTDGATIEAWPGGEVRFPWDAWGPDKVSAELVGKVLEVEKPERFVYEWEAGPGFMTTVEVAFEGREDGTVVRLRESGYPTDAQGMALMLGVSAGWGEALTLMKFYVEHGLRY